MTTATVFLGLLLTASTALNALFGFIALRTKSPKDDELHAKIDSFLDSVKGVIGK